MSIQNCIQAIRLVGKTVRPAPGTERWARANGNPIAGVVVNVLIPDTDHPYVVVRAGGDVHYAFPFELEVLTEPVFPLSIVEAAAAIRASLHAETEQRRQEFATTVSQLLGDLALLPPADLMIASDELLALVDRLSTPRPPHLPGGAPQ